MNNVSLSQDSAVLSGRARPKSWGPGEFDKMAKRTNPKDASFKNKHVKYEQLQRQADMVGIDIFYWYNQLSQSELEFSAG